MKAKIKARITGITKDKDFVCFSLIGADGKVDTKMIPAQAMQMSTTLFLKEAIANEIKFGSIISFDISIDDPESI